MFVNLVWKQKGKWLKSDSEEENNKKLEVIGKFWDQSKVEVLHRFGKVKTTTSSFWSKIQLIFLPKPKSAALEGSLSQL